MDDDQYSLFDLKNIEKATPKSLAEMHQRYGKYPDHQCEDCQNFARYRQGSRWAKCILAKLESSATRDWSGAYEACGRFAHKYE